MKEYDLYVPLRSNAGKRVPAAKLNRLKRRLVTQFGGLIYFPQKNTGFWKVGAATFRDEIVILRVLAADSAKVRRFWGKLNTDLQSEWHQKYVLIVAHNVSLL